MIDGILDRWFKQLVIGLIVLFVLFLIREDKIREAYLTGSNIAPHNTGVHDE